MGGGRGSCAIVNYLSIYLIYLYIVNYISVYLLYFLEAFCGMELLTTVRSPKDGATSQLQRSGEKLSK